MDMQDRLNAAVAAARASGEMLLKRSHLDVEKKADHDYVTDMDRASERLIIDTLRQRFPQDGFLGEEGGVTQQGTGMWVIDPIDGTTNFIRNIPTYTISIAYMLDDAIQVGVVYAPALDEMFTATRGGGACLNGQHIHVSDVKEPEQALLGMSFVQRSMELSSVIVPQLLALLPQINDMRRLGSAAYDLCCVACGRTDAFIEPLLHLYDIAAGVLILREAGGMVTGFQDSEDVLKSGHVMASNGHLHAFFYDNVRLNGAKA